MTLSYKDPHLDQYFYETGEPKQLPGFNAGEAGRNPGKMQSEQ